ncbi:regulator of Vps4 activity in the MVB pathway-domain-containing protein [Russula earlei]|uniref:Regulator of Vps4 activity in the MVB pathway-domain-containing protein n=1 Tax=Russula earlei TaxID=71964 RepID=A0ACC0UFY9_9AGAM|nr:regulator of Vps4 activity in the MVB pathway-domain-containing protein [Russula earlei]
MTSDSWDEMSAKRDYHSIQAQFRLTVQRLGQLRDRKDAQGQVIGKDISILLQQGNETLARAKAQRLIQDEIMGHLLGILQMQITVLLEYFSDLESGNLSPAVLEAASTIVFAAPHVDSKDLLACRDFLGVRLGPHFLQTAETNKDRCVPARVVKALSAPPVSTATMQAYLASIAFSYNVQWTPEHRPSDVLGALSELLDRSSDTPMVDMSQLSKLCAYGIPNSPSWLRPRIWRLLLGTLPALKSSWEADAQKQRESYYDLVRRLLEPFSDLPPPTSPLGPLDAALTSSIKDLFRVPATLFSDLQEEPEGIGDCPLDPSANKRIKIPCSANLDIRLRAINRDNDISEIRLGDEADLIPEISVTSPGVDGSTPHQTIFSSHSFNTGNAHPKHASALIRLLYIHSCLNPANQSPHVASLLIPLYSVLHQEVESLDAAHVEADTFWLFEAMVGEFAELEDEEGGNAWMRRFGARLEWADPELSADLRSKGLDPGLPHYSYRWLAPLLTHTLPLPSVLSVWDALFARPKTTRSSSPKLEALLDICTSMLIRVRGPLFRLGKTARHTPSLWTEENLLLGPSSPLRVWELNDAFIEGMSLLQEYPVASAGGIDNILQTAVELRRRREEESKASNTNTTLGSRLRDQIWKGFTYQSTSTPSSPETSENSVEESRDEGDETETPSASASPSTGNLTSRLASVVWQGITNQSAMEVPPSPESTVSSFPASPLRPPSPVSSIPPPSVSPPPPVSPPVSPSSTASSWWSYAEKIRDSDAAASLSKVSTNWRVKAMQAWNKTPTSPTSAASDGAQSHVRRATDLAGHTASAPPHERSFSDTFRSEPYSPPPRPAYFRSPRNSMLPQPRSRLLRSPTPPDSGDDTASTQAKSLKDSIASLAGLSTVTSSKFSSKSGPRPLLLNSSSLFTGSTSPTPLRTPPLHMKGDSLSSTTPPASEVAKKTRRHDSSHSEWESDTLGSRIVPLNRRSVSPMAPQFHTGHGRLQSLPSEKGVNGQDLSLNQGSNSPSALSDGSASRGWSTMDRLDSPTTIPASPPLYTPPPPLAALSQAALSSADSQRGPIVISEQSIHVVETPNPAKRLVRKKTPIPTRGHHTSDSSIALEAFPRGPRQRPKRPAQYAPSIPPQAGSPVDHTIPDTLAPPEILDDHDTAVTPRASVFQSELTEEDSASSSSPVFPTLPPIRTRKLSSDSRKANGDTPEPRARKISSSSHSPRTRKVSEGRSTKRVESASEEGDDEGYDDLLSAYESEDSVAHHVLH